MMEHPLIHNLSELTNEQLQEKIFDLQKKLAIAHQTGNAHICHQIRMALETYNNKYLENTRSQNNDNFDDKIDIS